MNTRTLIAALAFSFAGAAVAQEATIDNSPFVSSKTRTELRAEVIAARAAGQLLVSEADYLRIPAAAPNGVSRASVKAQTLAALASGELKALNAEAHSTVQPIMRRAAGQMLAVSTRR